MAKQFDISVVFKLIDKASPGLKKIGKSLKNAGQQLNDQVGKAAQLAGIALTAFAAVSARTAAEFQDSMNFVGAVTRATEDDFLKLTEVAKKMGEDTQFSAREAAAGLKELGLAGFGVEKSIAALPKVLELATSAQLGIGDAARIVTGIMAGYQFQTEDLTRVNDVLVNAFTKARVSLQPLGEAFEKLGPLAKNLGFDFNEITASFALLGKNAIEGSIAGTGMKRMFMELLSPSKAQRKEMKRMGFEFRKTDGSLKSMVDIIGEFEKAQKKGASQTRLMTAAARIFGSFGAQVFIPLLQEGSKGLGDFQENLKESGISSRVSKSQMLGLGGAFKLLRSKIESVSIEIFDTKHAFGRFFESQIRNLSDMIGKFRDWIVQLDSSVFNEFLSTFKQIKAVVTGFGEAIILSVKGLKEIAKSLGFFKEEIPDKEELENLKLLGQFLGIAFGAAAVASIVAFVTPWTAFIAGLGFIVANWGTISKFFKELKFAFPETAPRMQTGVFGAEGGQVFSSQQGAAEAKGRNILNTEGLGFFGGTRADQEAKIKIEVEAAAGSTAKVTNVEKKNANLTIDTKTGLTLFPAIGGAGF